MAFHHPAIIFFSPPGVSSFFSRGAAEANPGVADIPVIHPTNSLRSSARTPSQGPEGLLELKDKPLRGFANGDVCDSRVDPGVADVPVCQGPEGLSRLKDKPLRGFANGDVCGSRVDPGVADVLVCQGPEGLSDAKTKLLRSFANGDVCSSRMEGFRNSKNKLLRIFAIEDVCDSDLGQL